MLFSLFIIFYKPHLKFTFIMAKYVYNGYVRLSALFFVCPFRSVSLRSDFQ